MTSHTLRFIITTIVGLLVFSADIDARDNIRAKQYMPNLLATAVNNPDCERWVDSVFNTMTPDQRLGQLLFVVIQPAAVERSKRYANSLIKNYHVGGVLLSHGTLKQFADVSDYLHDTSPVPIIIAFDGEWGLPMRIYNTVRFPVNMATGAVQDSSLIYDYGYEMGRQCKLLGIDVNFAPVVDVNSNPANPVISYRSFGEDPQRVARAALAYSRGLEDAGVMAVAKHFPGHGDTDMDSHKDLPTIHHSMRQIEDIDLLPFRRFIQNGHSGIMTAHLSVPALDPSGRPASLSKKMTTDLLQQRLGFRGLIFTDALSMKGANTDSTQNALVQAFMAGNDVLLSPPDIASDFAAMKRAIRKGHISQDEVDRRCRKILTYKYALGLASERPSATSVMSQIVNPEVQAAANQLANASVTLLKDRNNDIPLSTKALQRPVLVNIGHAFDRKMDSTRTHSHQLIETLNKYTPHSIHEITLERNSGLTSADKKQIANASAVIYAVYADSLWATQALVNAIKCAPKDVPMVAAFLTTAYRMSKFSQAIASADVVLTVYDNCPASRQAIALAIMGGIDINGKMPVKTRLFNTGDGIDRKRTRLGYGNPAQAGLKASLTDSIDSLVNAAIAIDAFPGAQVLVAKNGMIVHNKSYGSTTKGGVNVNDSCVYDLASVSKAIGTLPAVMKSFDLGLLDLDEPITTYIPQITDSAKFEITPRQLLYHESGMPPSLNMFTLMMDTTTYTKPLCTTRPDKNHTIKIQRGYYGADSARLRTDITSNTRTDAFDVEAAKGLYVGAATLDTIMHTIYDTPLRASKKYTYSCLNFCLLMDINKRITGIDAQAFARDSIWYPVEAYTMCYRPLEHHSARQIVPTEKVTYLRPPQTMHGYVHDELANFSGGVQGNAGLFANATDIAKVCQMWLDGGSYAGNRIISSETNHLFTTDQSTTCRRGLGFDKPDIDPDNSPTCDEAPLSTFGHTGFTGTCFWVDPDNQIVFVFLSNRVNPTRDNDAFSSTSIRPRLMQQVYKNIK